MSHAYKVLRRVSGTKFTLKNSYYNIIIYVVFFEQIFITFPIISKSPSCLLLGIIRGRTGSRRIVSGSFLKELLVYWGMEVHLKSKDHEVENDCCTVRGGQSCSAQGPGCAQGLAVVQFGWKAGHLKVRKLRECQTVTGVPLL